MKTLIVTLLLAGCIGAQTPKVVSEVKPLRTIALTTEQNDLLVSVQRQMKELDEQFKRLQLGLQMRQQAIFDTISATNKLGAAELREVKPGEFEIREVPTKTEDKMKMVKDKQ